MKKLFWLMLGGCLLLSCKEKKESKKLEISGTISNNPARMIYLEEVPMTTMERIVVDSALLDKEGNYKLHAATGEARVYNLRLDQNNYPLAALINDASSITVNAKFNSGNRQFVEDYEIKGSPSSQQMKDFMVAFNGRLQAIFFNARKIDSLYKLGGKDSAINELKASTEKEAVAAHDLTEQALAKSNNPALSVFILGYYQSTAGNPAYRIEPLDKSEVMALIDTLAAKYSDHQGLAAIHSSLQGVVGKQAPDFTLPDPKGKMVSLSSFRGKYLLVDFWASWCKPCRAENPNVVKAYNQFKDKNFTILGVSLDKEKDAWMKAAMEDSLTWTHVSDLKEWNSMVVPLYKIEGIPYNVLLDPNGKIIGESLRGEELEKKLASVLK